MFVPLCCSIMERKVLLWCWLRKFRQNLQDFSYQKKGFYRSLTGSTFAVMFTYEVTQLLCFIQTSWNSKLTFWIFLSGPSGSLNRISHLILYKEKSRMLISDTNMSADISFWKYSCNQTLEGCVDCGFWTEFICLHRNKMQFSRHFLASESEKDPEHSTVHWLEELVHKDLYLRTKS